MPLGGLPDYFHYSWKNASQEELVQRAQNTLNQAKDNILSNYIGQYNAAFSDFQDTSGFALTDAESAVIDFAAKETLTEADLLNAMNFGVIGSTASGQDIGGGQGLIQAVYRLNELLRETNQTMVDLSNLMDAFSQATDLYQRIENAIIGNGGNMRLRAKNKSIVVQEIVQNILSNPDGETWNIGTSGKYDKFDINNMTNQWLVLLYALTTNQVPSGSSGAIKNAILQKVKKSSSTLVGALGEVASLYASTVGTANVLTSVDKALDSSKLKLEAKVIGQNSIGYEIKVEKDPAMQAMAEDLQKYINMANRTVITDLGNKMQLKFPAAQIKSDQTIWEDNLKVRVNNVSVKTTKSIKTLKNGSQRIGSLTIQSQSPLWTLLMREGRLNGSTVTGLLQIAIAQGGNEPDAVWNNLRNFLKQAMIVPALTGLGRENLSLGNLTTMIKINDYLIPMPQFLNYIQAMLTRQNGILGEQFTGYINLDGFPSRSKFTSINEWQPPSENNYLSAIRRSNRVALEGWNLLANTKVRMRLRNLNLTMLIKPGSIV